MQGKHWFGVLHLAFQCIGVVFGDLGASPLYVLGSTFPNGIQDPDDILGVLSVIIYFILTITVRKYTFMVLSVNNNGDDKLKCHSIVHNLLIFLYIYVESLHLIPLSTLFI
uniref:K+ potassium transporter integral membrane domain-containing protein n=1 Tax=Populus trichocarpa TaxID=3694 RepID=U7DXU8_POPTR